MDVVKESTLQATGERLLAEEYNEYTIEHLHRYAIALPLCEGKVVLDIASGEGYGGGLLANYAKRVIGVDISQEAVDHATAKYSRPNLEFRVGSADAIPVDSGSLDVVVSFETLEHHDKHEMMFAEIARVLRPGGLLIISTPDRRYFGGNPFHVKELDLEEFRSLVSKYFAHSGMYYQKTYFGSLLVPEDRYSGAGAVTVLSGGYTAIEKSNTIDQPIYNICLASSQDLPRLDSSFFDGRPALDQLKSICEEVPRNDTLIQNLRAVNESMANSLSFRLGRSLTLPFRLMGALFR